MNKGTCTELIQHLLVVRMQFRPAFAGPQQGRIQASHSDSEPHAGVPMSYCRQPAPASQVSASL
jgi:hypothetical protein